MVFVFGVQSTLLGTKMSAGSNRAKDDGQQSGDDSFLVHDLMENYLVYLMILT